MQRLVFEQWPLLGLCLLVLNLKFETKDQDRTREQDNAHNVASAFSLPENIGMLLECQCITRV